MSGASQDELRIMLLGLAVAAARVAEHATHERVCERLGWDRDGSVLAASLLDLVCAASKLAPQAGFGELRAEFKPEPLNGSFDSLLSDVARSALNAAHKALECAERYHHPIGYWDPEPAVLAVQSVMVFADNLADFESGYEECSAAELLAKTEVSSG